MGPGLVGDSAPQAVSTKVALRAKVRRDNIEWFSSKDL
jgi:hypothetical protein